MFATICRLLPCLAVVFCIGCGSESGDDRDAGSTSEPSPGFDAVWAEFLDPAGVLAALDVVEPRGLAVNMAWPASAVGDASYTELVRDAKERGVEIRPWLLLEQSEGYWPGATNAEAFAEAARSLFDEWDAQGLAPTTFIVDMEIRFDRAMVVNSMLQDPNADVGALLTLLADGIDRAQYASATSTYAALVDEAHARGWRVLLTTLPQVVDDYGDDDDDIRQAFGIPVDGVDWDIVTFQAYRTLFGDLLGGGGQPTEFYVYQYGRAAIDEFGARGGLDLGLVGMGVSESPTYSAPADLRADIEAAHAAGVPQARINVFGLDGMLDRGPAETWLGPPMSDPPAPAEDSATLEVRGVSTVLDQILDGAR